MSTDMQYNESCNNSASTIRRVIKMNTKSNVTNGFRKLTGKFLIILMGVLLVTTMSVWNFAFGADTNAGTPIREVHKVTVEDNKYCFFVTRNVVLTPAEIKGMTDEELTAEIFKKSGLYMKAANCRLRKHKAITVQDWNKAGRVLRLSDTDINNIRNAAPVDGNPVKMNLDVRIAIMPEDQEKPSENKPKPAEDNQKPADTDKPADGGTPADSDKPAEGDTPADRDTPADSDKPAEGDTPADSDKPAEGDTPADSDTPTEGDTPADSDTPSGDEEKPAEPVKEYSTFRLTSPGLVFIAVATENDAAYTEATCEEEKTDKDDSKKNSGKGSQAAIKGDSGSEPGEMLPELRTISMKDRSGGKLDETLEDGTPVTLEWIEPKKGAAADAGKSLIDRFPGGAAGLTVAGIIVAGLIAAAAVAIKKNQEE